MWGILLHRLVTLLSSTKSKEHLVIIRYLCMTHTVCLRLSNMKIQFVSSLNIFIVSNCNDSKVSFIVNITILQ